MVSLVTSASKSAEEGATKPQLRRHPQAFPELSDREREILDLIAQGHKNPEIAGQDRSHHPRP